jgi:hypothetical protein
MDSYHAIFTTAFLQGHSDRAPCSPANHFHLFLGSLRRVYPYSESGGDVVVAVDASSLTAEVKSILQYYNVVVYEISNDLCSKSTSSIYCGSQDERVPASVFRYFFFEKWAVHYQSASLLAVVDFRDVFFQSNPFTYKLSNWFPEHQLAVFQEFYPNMIINRCV